MRTGVIPERGTVNRPPMASRRSQVSRTPYRFARISLAGSSFLRPRNYAKFEVALAARNRGFRDIATHSCVLCIEVDLRRLQGSAARMGPVGRNRTLATASGFPQSS